MSEIHMVKSEYHKKYQIENRDKINERQRQRYNAKKQKQDEEKNKMDKLLVLIDGLNNKLEQTQTELREKTIDKKQLNDIQYAISRLLADKIVKDTEDDNKPVNPEPIKRYIKSLEVTSSSYQTESEDESNTEDSEFEIDADGNII